MCSGKYTIVFKGGVPSQDIFADSITEAQEKGMALAKEKSTYGSTVEVQSVRPAYQSGSPSTIPRV
jgi:hypothetical protein